MSASPVTAPATSKAAAAPGTGPAAAGAPAPPSADLARVLTVAAEVLDASRRHAQAHDFLSAWKAARAGAHLLATAVGAAPTTRVGVAIAAARDAADVAVRELDAAGQTEAGRANVNAQLVRAAAQGARRAARMLED